MSWTDAYGYGSSFADAIASEHCGFGDIPFRVRVTNGWPEWEGDTILVTRHIPGSNVNITQNMGKGPERVTYELMLASATDLRALRALVGTENTLTLVGDAASIEGTTVVFGTGTYQRIDNVLLWSIDSVKRLGGHIMSCMATFQKDAP